MPEFFDQYLVYHPAPWENRDWQSIAGIPLEDVWFQTEDRVRLFGWYAPNPRSSAVLLWCHRNAGNIIHRLDNLVRLQEVGVSVFLFDYRGYGRSQGRPSEVGLYRDALAAYTYLTETRRLSPKQIIIFGRSLGAAVATQLASVRPAAGLVLESAFPSIEAIARYYYYGLPVHWLLGARFPLEERLKEVHMPVLVVHGALDDIIPFELGKRVFEAANAPKSFYAIPNADHNNVFVVGGPPYYERLKKFVDEVVG